MKFIYHPSSVRLGVVRQKSFSGLKEAFQIFEVENQHVANHQGGNHEFNRGKNVQLHCVLFTARNSRNQSRRFVERRRPNCHREGEGSVAW